MSIFNTGISAINSVLTPIGNSRFSRLINFAKNVDYVAHRHLIVGALLGTALNGVALRRHLWLRHEKTYQLQNDSSFRSKCNEAQRNLYTVETDFTALLNLENENIAFSENTSFDDVLAIIDGDEMAALRNAPKKLRQALEISKTLTLLDPSGPFATSIRNRKKTTEKQLSECWEKFDNLIERTKKKLSNVNEDITNENARKANSNINLLARINTHIKNNKNNSDPESFFEMTEEVYKIFKSIKTLDEVSEAEDVPEEKLEKAKEAINFLNLSETQANKEDEGEEDEPVNEPSLENIKNTFENENLRHDNKLLKEFKKINKEAKRIFTQSTLGATKGKHIREEKSNALNVFATIKAIQRAPTASQNDPNIVTITTLQNKANDDTQKLEKWKGFHRWGWAVLGCAAAATIMTGPYWTQRLQALSRRLYQPIDIVRPFV